ncbi:hypothetical protein GTA08_BOTSDO13707 [Neofusicoccum parvum]|uniref:Uncharacterized protein n=1 Tax=Neofusicoccum parvum TaxID=310453 RepID=A0ACB5S9Y9_9PEZI|nr:hypothetical protein GTA08_BOTSDO13707 [Neofusicoccum parvum]
MSPQVGMIHCDPKETLKQPSKWSLGLYSIKNWTYTPYEEVWDVGSHPVSRCLAEPVTSPCALKYARNIHIVVIIANLAKVLVMIATMFQYRHPALVTVGDALASFLETPDPTTQELCLGRIEEFTKGAWTPEPKVYLVDKEASIRSSGASRTQWVATSTMLLLSGLSASIFLALIYSPQQDAFDWAFQSKIEPASLTLGRGLGTSPLIILANIPQLIISLDYLLLNRLVTSMAGACEWSLFAHQRKTLRTSLPRGAQRSTYWLSLPLKLSIPLMAVSAALHYFTSQSLQLYMS